MTEVWAVVLAGGRSRRLGEDKALVELGGKTAIERVVEDSLGGGAAEVVVVRAADAAPLPPLRERARIVTVSPVGEMIDSLRAGLAAVPPAAAALIWPIDHPLSGEDVVRALVCRLRMPPAEVVLPLCQERPGHPIGLAGRALHDARSAGVTSLREIVVADRERVATVRVANPWVLRDIDTPADLAAARAALRARWTTASELMRSHRSHRSYHPDPVPDPQLAWLVDAARYASTSSFIQSYSVVAVRDPARKQRIAQLCALQQHIVEAPVFLAICVDLHRLELSCVRHGVTFRPHSLEAFVEVTVDASLFAQNLQLAAESEGLGSCMIGAARNHPVALARLLELPPHVYVVFGMVVGRAADDPIPRGRLPLPAILHHETYDRAASAASLDSADEAMRAWAMRTNSERGGYLGHPVNMQKGWTDRMAVLWSKGKNLQGRARLLAELEQLGFRLVADASDGVGDH